MKNLTILLALILLIVGNAHAQRVTSTDHLSNGGNSPMNKANKNAKITYKLIPDANQIWGYDVYVDDKLTIHQPIKPGLPGNEGFTTKAAAAKMAKLVVGKIKNDEMPPSVTV